MKIGYLAKTIDPRSGGGRYAARVIEGARAAGHEVIILKEEEDGCEGKAILRKGFGMILSMPSVRWALRDCDAVHAFDVWPYSLPGYAAVVGTRKKLFVSGVGTYSVAPLESLLKRQILKHVLGRAKKIFCISTYVMEEMRKRLPLPNLALVHLGFSPLPKLSEEEKALYRKRYAIDASLHPILLTVGAVKHRKGQFDTVRALSTLVLTHPNLLYVMVGTSDEQPYISKIEAYAESHGLKKNIMIVSDAKSDAALSFFYDTSDLFVMNSNNAHGHFEGFGLVFLEAAGFGKPVVGSSNCGIEDALEDSFNGYLTVQGDAEDIAKKVALALEKKDELGRNSLEFVKGFSWEKTVRAYLLAYRED